MWIDRFISAMARERSRSAAEAREARQGAAEPPPEAAPARPARENPPDQGKKPEAVDLEDEVRAFLQRDEVRDVQKEEVADFMDFMGNAAFDPDSLPE